MTASGNGEALALAALANVGCKFRFRGRDPETGLDCVGLVVHSLRTIGRKAVPPIGYSLRSLEAGSHLLSAWENGLVDVADGIVAGDVLLARTSPIQSHLLIATAPTRFVHADARIGRVCETEGPLDWPIIHHWRLATD